MKRTMLFLSILFVSKAALAATPGQFAAPNVRAPDDPNVDGFRVSVLHGENQSVRGLDLGLLSVSETSDLSGFGAVLGMNRISGEMNGVSGSLVNVHSGSDRGVNAAFVNRIHSLEEGVNIGFVNIADDFTRVDLGGLNVSDESTVQLGFVNVTGTITGVQIGFLNAAENGFLPVFPFFNFPKD